MKTRKKLWIFLLSLFCLVLGGCGAQEGETEAEAPGVSWESLSFPQELEILYATQFSAASSPEGYTKISIEDGLSYLVVPEGAAGHTLWLQCQTLDRSYDISETAMTGIALTVMEGSVSGE